MVRLALPKYQIFQRNKLKNKKVLISGGAGFVGSNLAKFLKKLGAEILIYDNLSTGNIDNVKSFENIVIGETREINEKVKFSPDYVFHLGEYSRVEQSFEDIDITFESNLASIYSVLKFCKENNSKIIYAGSSTKFGDEGSTRWESPYALTKSLNTEVVKTFCEWFDLKYAISYFYNVYGAGEIAEGKHSTVVAKFLKLIKEGNNDLPVVSPGTQERNFTHISDILSGLILVAELGYGDNYGIGSDESYTLFELVDMLEAKPVMLPERRGNRMSAPVNTDKTKDLGWSANTTLQHYLCQELNNLKKK